MKAYKAKYGVVPDSLAALAYDAANVLADAIKRAGGTDSAKLKDAINSTKDFAGVTGKITLDAKRNAVKPAVVLELDPATSNFKYKETIAPEGSAATATAANSNSATAANSSMPSNTSAAANTASPANASNTK